MKVLVTGAKVMIGSALITLFARNSIKVVGIDKINPKSPHYFEFYQGDICSNAWKRWVSVNHPDINHIIHLAARTDLEGANLRDYETNIKGTEVVCELANSLKTLQSVCIIFTQLVADITSGKVGADLSTVVAPNIYGESKQWTEKVTREKLKNIFSSLDRLLSGVQIITHTILHF